MGADLRGMYDPNASPSGSFEVLPAGVYTVKLESGDWKNTKKGDGRFLQVNLAVVEGEHEGSLLAHRFNLDNPSQEAVRIANSEFRSLCEAVGVLSPLDTEDLKGIRFQVVVKCERRNDDPDKMTNRITRFIKHGESATTPQQAPEAPPWSRNAPRQDPPQMPDMPFDDIPF
jgi:hypothetical protein